MNIGQRIVINFYSQQNFHINLTRNISISKQTVMIQINETQLMRENLQRMLKNENYFSNYFQKSHQQQQSQPANPFRKKMFDKKLRRSTVSCQHYNSMSIHHQSKADESNDNKQNNSRLSTEALMKISVNNELIRLPQQLTQSPLKIQKTQKMKLVESRQSIDPNKEKITQIINNFRHELDYLQQKLHAKVDALYEKYHHSQQQQQSISHEGEMEFMMESLERIVGFMVENCVNLQDVVMCGGRQKEQDVNQEQCEGQQSNYINMKREVYEIQDDREQQQGKENISFGDIQPQLNFKVAPAKRTHALRQRPIGEQNNINMPNTFFVNDKLHSNERPKLSNINTSKIPYRQHTKSRRQQHQRPTNRHPPKHHNRRGQINNKDLHSHKDNNQTFSSSSNSNYNSCGVESQPLPTKSIYESVLEEREMRMKLKKRIV